MNYIIIDHGNKISTVYAHCSKLLVKVGQTVKRGDVIGYVGKVGLLEDVQGSHLHFELWIGDLIQDANEYIEY